MAKSAPFANGPPSEGNRRVADKSVMEAYLTLSPNLYAVGVPFPPSHQLGVCGRFLSAAEIRACVNARWAFTAAHSAPVCCAVVGCRAHICMARLLHSR